jgi:nitrogen-specific signal transduction histidine kinase
MIPEVNSTLGMHVEADSGSKRTLKDVDKCVLLFHSILEKFNEAAVTDLPTLGTVRLSMKYKVSLPWLFLKEDRLRWF